MSDYEPKVVHFPGTRLSPEVVLQRTLAKLDHIESVAIVIGYKDSTKACDWSQMKVSELCMASMVLSEEARDVMMGRDPDAVQEPDGGA